MTGSAHLRRCVGIVVFGAATALIATTTLTPAGPAPSHRSRCFWCDEFATTDFIANVALFAPWGAALALMGFKGRNSAALAAVASTLIELTQYVALPGRDATVRDVVANTAGASVGWLVLRHARGLAFPSGRSARGLAVVGGGLWLTLQVLGTWLEAPSLPAVDYWGQWAPAFANMRHFEGTVLGAHLNGGTMPRLRIPGSDTLRARLREQGTAVDAVIVTEGAEPGLAPVVSMYDSHQEEIFLLGERGADAVFRARRRAADLLLRNPGIAVRGVIDRSDTLRLTGGMADGRLRVGAGGGAHAARMELALGGWLLWTHLIPFDHELGSSAMLIATAWMAALLFPLGYWAGQATGIPAPARLIGGMLLLILGFGLVPFVFSFPGPPPVVWSGAIGGSVAGASASWMRLRAGKTVQRAAARSDQGDARSGG